VIRKPPKFAGGLMPIYEYACPKCGEFEVTQRITADPLKKCPTCKSTKVKKLISSTSFQLKGTGWYVTDYAR
jgi:putative FmdB family regulatory protein